MPSPPTFTYQYGANPPIDYLRMLTSDTVEFQPDGTTRAYIWSDEELTAFTTMQSLTWQTSMFYSYPQGQNLPNSPVNYLRIAACILDATAVNSARLAALVKLLDVTLDPKSAAMMLKDLADNYRTVDDNTGAFAVIEQCSTSWAFSDRYWNQVQRQTGQ